MKTIMVVQLQKIIFAALLADIACLNTIAADNAAARKNKLLEHTSIISDFSPNTLHQNTSLLSCKRSASRL